MARPALSEEQVDEERRRLCLAALRLYRVQGYEAVTLRKLGAAAGVSHATPYQYFRSKDDLFLHVRAEVFRQFGDFLLNKDPLRGDPLSRLRKIVAAIAEFGRQSPDDYRLLFSMRQMVAPEDSPLTIARGRVLDYGLSVCQQAIDCGQIKGDANTQLHLALAGVHGLLSLHVSKLLVNNRSLDDLLEPMLDRLFPPARALTKPKTRRREKSGP